MEDLLVVDVEAGAPIAGRVEPALEPVHEVYEALVLGTRDYVRKNGFTDVLISLSGGIDSSLVAAIAVDALGAEHVHGVMLPSRYSSEGSVADAVALTDRLGVRTFTVPIEPAQAAFEEMLAPVFEGRPPDVAEENLQARIRGNAVMTISNKFGWMVLSCGNKSEMATGYATLYGDMAGGFAVIKDVPKTLVYALCRDLNARSGRDVIPQAVLDKPPSAELRPDQKDTDSLPEYDELDPIIEGYVEGDESVAELTARGFDDELARRVARMVDRNEYKRRQAPPGVRVLAQGVRQGPPSADHQPLARLTSSDAGHDPGTRAAAAAGARADRGDDRVRQHVRDRPGRARARDAGRLHPVAVHDRHDRARADRAPTRLPPTGRRRDRTRRSWSRACAFGLTGFAGYWFQNAGLQRTTTSELRVHHRPVRRVHADDRGARDAPGAGSAACSIAVVVSAVGLFLLTGASLEIGAGDALTLGCAVMFAALDLPRRDVLAHASTRSRSPPRRWR